MSLKDTHNLDYTILLCRNMKETRSFYKDVMGFPIELDLENRVSFRVGADLLTDGNLGPPIRTGLHVSARAAPRAVGTVLRRPRAASDLRHRDGSGHASAA
jgi:lactoylglutathione lyase